MEHMRRFELDKRVDWKQRCESVGFTFHTDTDGSTYWDESVCYVLSPQAVNMIENATNELHARCMEAVNTIVNSDRYLELMDIPREFWPAVRSSWHRQEPALYGRFDLIFDGISPPKMLEYNADTPTSLLEASVVQWFWQGEVFPECDQFNNIHDRLLSTWPTLRIDGSLHLGATAPSVEDCRNVVYLMDTAKQCGIDVQYIWMQMIGLDTQRNVLIDGNNNPIRNLFKLYPWEWILKESFSKYLITPDGSPAPIRTFEPAWKMILSNKAILPIMWELFPDHPNLLPAYFQPDQLNSVFVKKPVYGREGANVTIQQNNASVSMDGEYGHQKFIYQAFQPIPDFGGFHPILGSWVIGGKAAGIGIREDAQPVTSNTSRFVPHVIETQPGSFPVNRVHPKQFPATLKTLKAMLGAAPPPPRNNAVPSLDICECNML